MINLNNSLLTSGCAGLSALCVAGSIFGLDGIQERVSLYALKSQKSLAKQKQSKMVQIIFGTTPLSQRISLLLASVLLITPLAFRMRGEFLQDPSNLPPQNSPKLSPQQEFAAQLITCAMSKPLEPSYSESELEKCNLADQCKQIKAFLSCVGFAAANLSDQAINSNLTKSIPYLHPDKNPDVNITAFQTLLQYKGLFKQKMSQQCEAGNFQKECEAKKDEITLKMLDEWAKQSFPGKSFFEFRKIEDRTFYYCFDGKVVESKLNNALYCIKIDTGREMSAAMGRRGLEIEKEMEEWRRTSRMSMKETEDRIKKQLEENRRKFGFP